MRNWFSKSPSKDSQIQLTPEQQKQILDLLIHQAEVTFKLAIGIYTLSTIVMLMCVVLFLFNKIQPDRINVGVSILASLVSFKSANDAKKDLMEILAKSKHKK